MQLFEENRNLLETEMIRRSGGDGMRGRRDHRASSPPIVEAVRRPPKPASSSALELLTSPQRERERERMGGVKQNNKVIETQKFKIVTY